MWMRQWMNEEERNNKVNEAKLMREWMNEEVERKKKVDETFNEGLNEWRKRRKKEYREWDKVTEGVSERRVVENKDQMLFYEVFKEKIRDTEQIWEEEWMNEKKDKKMVSKMSRWIQGQIKENRDEWK